MTAVDKRLHDTVALLAAPEGTDPATCLHIPVSRESFEQIARPYYAKAHRDGYHNRNCDLWTKWWNEHWDKLEEILGHPPLPGEVDVFKAIGQICEIAWCEGRLAGRADRKGKKAR